MRSFKRLKLRRKSRAFKLILAPIFERFKSENELESRGYRPLQMSFDDQLKALIFYHLQEYSSGSELLQALEQNDFAKECVAPSKGIKKSSFFEAINTRGLEQLTEVFTHLVKQAGKALPAEYVRCPVGPGGCGAHGFFSTGAEGTGQPASQRSQPDRDNRALGIHPAQERPAHL
jgi:hypothetical protein